MAKNDFLSWDTTANNNTDVAGVNIAEGCAPSGINNAIRAIMAQLRAGVDGEMVYVTKAANYTALGADNNAFYRFSASATLSLTAVATLAANWHIWVKADGGDVTIDPNASETINGATTLVIRNGESALVVSSGTAFFATVNPSSTPFAYQLKTANYTALDGDYNSTFRFTSAATLAFDVTANLRTNWRIEVWNDSTGLVIIDPDSTNTINGSTTLAIQPGQRMEIYKTSSTAFQGAFYADTLQGPQLQGYITGLTLSNNATDAVNDMDTAIGAAAADTAPFYLMQLSTGLTKRLDAAWAVGNNQGGLDTGSVINGTYHMFLIQRSDTGVADVLFSASATAPTMPASYDRKRRIGSIIRVSAAIKAFRQRGDNFRWAVSVSDWNQNTPTNTETTRNISVPTGIGVMAILNITLQQQASAPTGNPIVQRVYETTEADATPDISNAANWRNPNSGHSISNEIRRYTTTAQLKERTDQATAATTVFGTTLGWEDNRGSV